MVAEYNNHVKRPHCSDCEMWCYDVECNRCGPCKKMKVELSEVASKLENVIKVAKVDTDRAPKLSAKYEVHALPTLILFSNGEVVEK